MRSYYEHLKVLLPSTSKIIPRPTFRSSAIFPVINSKGISSRILFLGYWLLKRNIRYITSVVTLRSEDGKVVDRQVRSIEDVRAYRIELCDLLEEVGLSSESPFLGSLEIEFFSTVHLVFPFPAVVINYYGPQFSSVVHTAQRVYNDYDDMCRNSQTDVAESGFNIYADDDHEPFIGLINGLMATPHGKMRMLFLNSEGGELLHEVDLGPMAPYQTRMIYPAQLVDLKSFLKGKPGAAKVTFQVNWIFPRLIAGNIQHSLPAMTLTHTYYDCSTACSDSDYWRTPEPQWHPASLSIPLSHHSEEYTNVYFYPIYSPAKLSIDIEIYNASGQCLGKKNEAISIDPSSKVQSISLDALCEELKIEQKGDLAARIIAHAIGDSRFPARIKLGVDVGKKGEVMSCNICTNLQPFNPPMESKPITFRWAPILADQQNASFWILSSSPAVDFRQTADVEIMFYREKDREKIVRQFSIAPHGFYRFDLEKDKELMEFFGKEVGWFTATTTNPYTSTYYFAKNRSGVVGGDHGF